jgi:hypothetical protein
VTKARYNIDALMMLGTTLQPLEEHVVCKRFANRTRRHLADSRD